MNSSPKKETCIIIGGGPAGATTAMQLTRYGFSPLLLERREVGGLLWNANLVENYPGFPNGVRGEKLISLLKSQMQRLGVHVEREEVRSVDWRDDHFLVTTSETERSADTVVIASGTKSKPLPEGIHAEARAGVFTEVWPLAGEAEKQMVIVGAGDAAFDYALNLAKNRNFVTILNRGETVKCLPLLFERAAQEKMITYRSGVTFREVKGEQGGARIEVRAEARGGEAVSFSADYILFAVGREPNRDFLSGEIQRREKELVEAGRLYFVGDVKNEEFRQVAIAAGDGLRAAMQIYQRMSK